MPMYDLIEYSNKYSKISGILWKYCRDVLAVDNDGEGTDFTEVNVTDLFNLKEKITGETGDSGTKNVEVMVPLKCLNNFWRTLETPLINCEITLDLNWSGNCVTVATKVTDQVTTFSINDTKRYVPVVTLSA